MKKSKYAATQEFEERLAEPRQGEQYLLRLYITGMNPRSAEALAAIKKICEEQLEGQYTLEVIDIYQHPEVAREEQLIAAPTLIKKLPAPLRRLVGSLSETGRVLAGLGLKPADSSK
jgi:circadian clock protein KaiB